jgi:hypothetical protein
MSNQFDEDKNRIKELEEDLKLMSIQLAKQKEIIIDTGFYKDKKNILLVKQQDIKTKERTQDTINDLIQQISKLDKTIREDQNFINLYKDNIKNENKLKEINLNKVDLEIINEKQKTIDRFLFSKQEQIEKLNMELAKYSELKKIVNNNIRKDRRYISIMQNTKSDSELAIFQKLKNYYNFENLQFLLSEEEYSKFIKKILINDNYINFWKHELDVKKDNCKVEICNFSDYFSSEVYKNIDDILFDKSINQSVFVCLKKRGFHLGHKKKNKNFILEHYTAEELSKLIYQDQKSTEEINRLKSEIINLKTEVKDAEEKFTNYKNLGLDKNNSEIIEIEINNNYQIFGLKFNNKEREESYKKKELNLSNKQMKLNLLHDKLNKKENLILRLFKQDKEKVTNLKNFGLFETNKQLEIRNEYKINETRFRELEKLLKDKKEELRIKQLEYYTELAMKRKNNNTPNTYSSYRNFDYYDKNST